MEKNYISVRTKQVPHMRTTVRDSQFVVQVQEEDRPKPKLDSRLLILAFNICNGYLRSLMNLQILQFNAWNEDSVAKIKW
jgi:hypothetical protein